jgi:hypothetical protein
MRQAQREEAARRQHARERRSLLIIVGALVVGAAAIGIVSLYLYNSTPRHLKFQTVAHPENVGQVVADEGSRNHVPGGTQVTYKNQPPTSGPHYAQTDGAPVAWQYIGTLQPELWVHNLEHGGIVLLYNCPSGCDDLVKQLTTYVNSIVPADPKYGEYKIVMSPYGLGMGTHRVAVLAWDRIEFLEGYNQAKITEFYEARVDQGPEPVP